MSSTTTGEIGGVPVTGIINPGTGNMLSIIGEEGNLSGRSMDPDLDPEYTDRDPGPNLECMVRDPGQSPGWCMVLDQGQVRSPGSTTREPDRSLECTVPGPEVLVAEVMWARHRAVEVMWVQRQAVEAMQARRQGVVVMRDLGLDTWKNPNDESS